jgi:broad specificity phosphatase PhoE
MVMGMLMVVRHADAGDKRSWTGLDRQRPLSATGRRQADGLVVRLEDYPVERILSSPTLRCLDTVWPLARDRFLEVEPVAALGVDGGLDPLLAMLLDEELRNAVLCTHGETIGLLVARLVEDGLDVGGPLQWPKGSTWMLQRTDNGRRHVRGRLLAPLELDGRVPTG